jgi:tRNA A-37 threonylcarbamoyl transferase component Bud32
MKLSPLETFRKTTNTLYTVVDGNDKYLVKSYCGPRNLARYRQEKLSLGRWQQAGFNVPTVHDIKIPSAAEPYLVISFIEGPSLREYLSQSAHALDEKLETLRRLFSELAKRHDLAIRTNNIYLIHHDPSSGNIIYTKSGFYFIDFETPVKQNHSVLESASIEVATTCRWIVRDLGIESLDKVLTLAAAAYRNQEPVLKLIVDRTTARPFQFYHRWKNKKRKLVHPEEVTKYDIADGLAKLSIDTGLC